MCLVGIEKLGGHELYFIHFAPGWRMVTMTSALASGKTEMIRSKKDQEKKSILSAAKSAA